MANVDNISTYIGKDHYGKWKATSTLMLGDKQQLSISTYKSHGELRTYASVGKLDRGFVTHRIYQDYHKCFASEDRAATGKAVEAQHRSVLAKIDLILDDVTRHYNKDAALVA